MVVALLSRLAARRLSDATLVIGITGSVGKTTAKEVTALILAIKYRTQATKKSFNSEFGLPLTILEETSGGSSPRAWASVLTRAIVKSKTKLTAEMLVLELGVDQPGDMDHLLSIVQPTIGMCTAVAPVHLAPGQFRSVEEIAHEKAKLIETLPGSGTAILNADDPLVTSIKTTARTIRFGIHNPADVMARQITETATGITCDVVYGAESLPLQLPIVGIHNLYPILAGITVGLAVGIELRTALTALADFRLPPGRGNVLPGVSASSIIDGSYNANPASTRALLETLQRLPATRKIAVLGQMNELGDASGDLHRKIGTTAVQVADLVIGVYGDADIIVETVREAGKEARFFETAREAGEYLRGTLAAGDLVLVKGSQNNVRLEKCVKEILADPTSAEAVLCRQGEEWYPNA